MSKNISIVVGSLFGDEGKGAHVNYLCSQVNKPLVIRFNGGHQVGHTVVIGDKRHPFSNFGSGTLQGAPTYWSEFCTVSPIGVKKEGQALSKLWKRSNCSLSSLIRKAQHLLLMKKPTFSFTNRSL